MKTEEHLRMNTYLDCIPCFVKQALFAARAATEDEKKIKQVLDRVAGLIPDIPLRNPPPETARLIYSAVREVTGVLDPFKPQKDKSIEKALSLYDELKAAAESSEDPLRMAVKIAIAGNVIDLGANPDFDLKKDIREVLKEDLPGDHYQSFEDSTNKARLILYLGDNAGETVFDRILIEILGKDTIYTVRGIPIINDATIEDAKKSGIDTVARIVSSGCDTPGTVLRRCSNEFLKLLDEADLIISKGQGNFESLIGEDLPIFFLLKVKCPVIARHLGTKNGNMILKDGRIKQIESLAITNG